ncbi:unnamed protein product [Xylocopa violacea]|uniref:Uncharacterized protein n=1 Tax=Xylocopa violacea TaxID=135666 RepID=A0ABP1NME1_XYLVO
MRRISREALEKCMLSSYGRSAMRGFFRHLLLLASLIAIVIYPPVESQTASDRKTKEPMKMPVVLNIIRLPLRPCPPGQRRDLLNQCRPLVTNRTREKTAKGMRVWLVDGLAELPPL